MFSRRISIESIRRLSWLAAVSVGIFCFLSGCGLRSADKYAADEIISPSLAHPTAQKDIAVPRSLSLDFPFEDFKDIRPEAQEWIYIYEKNFGFGKASEIILNSNDITAFNQQIKNNCPTVDNITAVPTELNGAEVREMIQRYTMPNGNKYDKNAQLISDETKNQILENRNLAAIGETVSIRCAVVTSRCDLKSMPTDLDFHNYGDQYYSDIQETELITSFPVWILHESMDGKFLFAKSYYYSGWIPADAVAVCSEEDFQKFSEPERFVTIIQPSIYVEGIRLDMGAVLPYLSEDEAYFYVQLPVCSENGMLDFRTVSVSKKDAFFGYLPYTMENYYNQAFAYLGTLYGWGGMNGGVDCSGYICAVFRTFGIYLPRNTGEQKLYSGKNHQLSNHSYGESAAVFEQIRQPASIHRPGHVMLYLGMRDGIPYVIHAPRGGEAVSVMPLGLPGNLQSAAVLTGLDKES